MLTLDELRCRQGMKSTSNGNFQGETCQLPLSKLSDFLLAAVSRSRSASLNLLGSQARGGNDDRSRYALLPQR